MGAREDPQRLGNARSSFWFIPSLMTASAAAAGIVALDRRLPLPAPGTLPLGWVYGGGVDGARALLQVVAGSMITVAGVVFSITTVALTLTSQQYGPRLLGKFMHDTGNQTVLGAFVSTFVYCQLVLRTVQADGDGSARRSSGCGNAGATSWRDSPNWPVSIPGTRAAISWRR